MAKSMYAVHPGVTMVQNAIASLPGKTGRSLDEWVAFIRKHGPKGEPARKAWLKSAHALGTNYAGWLAAAADGKGETGDADTYLATAERYVEDMFAGAKGAAPPVVRGAARRAHGRSARTSRRARARRSSRSIATHVFAQIKPTTRTRIDLGLALRRHQGDRPVCIDTGGFEER